MIYKNMVKGKFHSRPNRFIAYVNIDDRLETAHVKNTGRCKELLLPGADVMLQLSDNPNRKTKYDLISVYKQKLGWVNIDSQAPNKVVMEWLSKKGFDLVKPEFKYGDSRIDFYMEKGEEKILCEVKGCTLEIEGQGYFPDAPTDRGVKHLRELIKAAKEGYICYIAFVIAMEGVTNVLPNAKTHKEFEITLNEAKKAGVKVLNLSCEVTENTLEIISEAFFY